MVRHTTTDERQGRYERFGTAGEDTDAGDHARYWLAHAQRWFDRNVHGKDIDEFIAIAGDAVVELPESWSASDIDAAVAGMYDAYFPPVTVEDRHNGGTRLRIDADDVRLPTDPRDDGGSQ
jgi:hypothetical protein